MKIRHGFISNSSTTSFVLVGTSLDSDEFRGFLNKELFFTEEFAKSTYNDLEEIKDEFDEVDLYEIAEYINNKSNVDFEIGYESESVYVGISPSPRGKGTILEQLKRSGDRIQNIHNIVNNCEFFTDKGKKKILANISWHEEAYLG